MWRSGKWRSEHGRSGARFQRQAVVIGDPEVKDSRGQVVSWLEYLAVQSPRLVTAAVLTRDIANREL